MKSQPIYCLSYFKAKKGCREKLIAALATLIQPTRSENGCLLYELTVDKSDPDFLIMIEKFIDETALGFHEKQPYIKLFIDDSMNELCEQVTWHEAYII